MLGGPTIQTVVLVSVARHAVMFLAKTAGIGCWEEGKVVSAGNRGVWTYILVLRIYMLQRTV